MFNTCIYINKKDATNGWKFCDLYNKETGEVWELKRYSKASSCQRSAAINQLDGYLCGCLKHNKRQTLTAGKTQIPGGFFTHNDNGGVYFIWYWDDGDGILFYDYVFYKDRNNSNTKWALLGLSAEIATIIGLGFCYNSMGTNISSPKEEIRFDAFSNAA